MDLDINLCKRMVKEPEFRVKVLKELALPGQEFIGYCSNYVPEEIITALNCVPVRFIGRQSEATNIASQYLTSDVCSLVKDIFTSVFIGNNDFLSKVILPHSCDSLYGLSNIWQEHLKVQLIPFSHPSAYNSAAQEFYRQEIVNLTERLSAELGRKLHPDDLQNAVIEHNNNRILLRTIYQQMQKGLINASAYVAMLTAGLYLPKKIHNEMLDKLITDNFNSCQNNSDEKIKAILSGPVVDNLELLNLMERYNLQFVVLDITNGYRYIDGNISLTGDVYNNLAEFYLNKTHSPTLTGSTYRFDRLKQEIINQSVRSAVFVIQKHCDPHLFMYPELKKLFQQNKIPSLLLQIEHQQGIDEMLETRVAAFTESLSHGK